MTGPAPGPFARSRPRRPGPGDPLRAGPLRTVAVLADDGGPCRVLLARTDRGRALTVKAVRPEYAALDGFRAGLRVALGAAGAVAHPGLAEWTGGRADEDPPWIASAHLPGLGLAEAVTAAGPLPEPVLRSLAAGLLATLGVVHAAGAAHLALTPGNVLLTAAGPVLLDLGCSVRAVVEGSGAAAAETLGRPGPVPPAAAFRAPEAGPGGRAGPEADLYALGALLVWAATGRPYPGRGPTGSPARPAGGAGPRRRRGAVWQREG
ncbi:hypothetical protein ACFVHW_29595, partial [Streptomyces sp. NPDC127110]